MDDREAAFRRLYDAELPYVIRTLRRLGVSARDVEDAAHDLFVIVHRKLDELEPGRPARPWLFGIAYRVVGNRISRAARRPDATSLDDDAHADPQPGPDQLVEAEEVRIRVLRALAELDLDQRAVCALIDLEQRTAPEVATILDVPVNTVYSRLRLGRQKLAATLRRMKAGDR